MAKIPMKGFWRHFVTGLFVILPAFLTVGILQFLFGWAFQWITPLAIWISPYVTSWWALLLAKVLVIIAFVFLITLVGLGTHLIVIRQIFSLAEELFRRVPMVGKIYGTIREISNTFRGERQLFSRVVLLEWPHKGMYAIGFVTSEGKGEVQEKIAEYVVNVFLPTTPNPTSGFLVLVPRESLVNLDMSVEDGMKLVISGGVVGPPVKVP